MAGMEFIPAYVRLANDQESLEMALVENIQRQDLDPIEIGLSYQRLIEEINLTQEQLSERVGKKKNYYYKLYAPIEIRSYHSNRY
jgi:ParB family chromosome partitioning protein